MEATTKTIVEVPYQDFQELKANQEKILHTLQNLKLLPQPEYLTANEFMSQTKMSRWIFDRLRQSGKLELVRRGRKWFIPPKEVQRYFQGELE